MSSADSHPSYKVPEWAGEAAAPVSIRLDVIKNGIVVDRLRLSSSNSYTSVGRIAENNIVAQHPSISRTHAFIQWADSSKKLFLYDNGSVHGTFVNKTPLKSKEYVELRNGYCLKLAASTRLYVVNGLVDDEVSLPADALAPSREQVKKMYEKYKRVSAIVRQERSKKMDLLNVLTSESEEDDNSLDNSIRDPLNTLKVFFEEESGEQLSKYISTTITRSSPSVVKDEPFNTIVRIKLPPSLMDSAEKEKKMKVFEVKGTNEQECLQKCALEACQYLSACGALLNCDHDKSFTKHDKAAAHDWQANDYYGSDEDPFFDRTGELEEKRRKRIDRMSGAKSDHVHSFESLTVDMKKFVDEEVMLRQKLDKSANAQKAVDEGNVDSYIESLKAGALDSRERMKIKLRLAEINQLQKRTLMLIEKAARTPKHFEQWQQHMHDYRTKEDQSADTIKSKKACLNNREHKPVAAHQKAEQKSAPSRGGKSSRKRDFMDDKFEKWVPPQGQSGDGRTELNEKLGY